MKQWNNMINRNWTYFDTEIIKAIFSFAVLVVLVLENRQKSRVRSFFPFGKWTNNFIFESSWNHLPREFCNNYHLLDSKYGVCHMPHVFLYDACVTIDKQKLPLNWIRLWKRNSNVLYFDCNCCKKGVACVNNHSAKLTDCYCVYIISSHIACTRIEMSEAHG